MHCCIAPFVLYAENGVLQLSRAKVNFSEGEMSFDDDAAGRSAYLQLVDGQSVVVNGWRLGCEHSGALMVWITSPYGQDCGCFPLELVEVSQRVAAYGRVQQTDEWGRPFVSEEHPCAVQRDADENKVL